MKRISLLILPVVMLCACTTAQKGASSPVAAQAEQETLTAEQASCMEVKNGCACSETGKPPSKFAIALEQAKNGYIPSQYDVAVMYNNGQGTAPDAKAAYKWYQKAAQGGYPPAIEKMAFAYYGGVPDIIERDYKKSASYAYTAAIKGLPDAQYLVGRLHSEGAGLNKDMIKAYEWYLRAAEQGVPEAQYNIGVFNKQGLAAAPNEALAFEWFMKSAEQNYAKGQTAVGIMYLNGQGVKKSKSKGKSWLKKAAAGGDAQAKEILAAK